MKNPITLGVKSIRFGIVAYAWPMSGLGYRHLSMSAVSKSMPLLNVVRPVSKFIPGITPTPGAMKFGNGVDITETTNS